MNKNPIFRAGQRYKIRTQTVKVSRTVERPNAAGEQETLFLSGAELAIFVTGEDGKEYLVMDKRLKELGATIEGEVEKDRGYGAYKTEEAMEPDLDIQTLVKHFHIPTAPDVGQCFPERYRANLGMIDQIEATVGTGFKCKPFQRRDLARAALHDGLILCWEQGCGKNLGGIIWALLKVGLHPDAGGKLLPAEPVLIVSPKNLHKQGMMDYENLFGAAWPGCTEISSQDDFLKLAKGCRLKPGFYISSFTEVAMNKVRPIPTVPEHNGLPDAEIVKLMKAFNVKIEDAAGHRLIKKTTRGGDGKETISFHRTKPHEALTRGCEEADIHEKIIDLCAEKRRELADGVDTEKNGIRCVYSPSLADLVRHAFGCVVVDEAVRIKAEDSIIGIGVRSLCPKYRLVLTGTPIKNRLPDIFFLAAWACDALEEATARWPYCAKEEGEHERFSEDFLIFSRNLTKEAKESEARGGGTRVSRRSKQRRGKPTAEVANIHRLWKLLAPVVLRRRKADIGEDIQPKIRRPIVVPMGTEQAAVTKYHLKAQYLDKNLMPAIGAQLQALRSCAAAPHNTETLHDKGAVEWYPRGHELEGQPMPYQFVSCNPFTPRNLACLRVIEEVLLRKEQVVVASAFCEANDQLSRMLTEAGVAHDVLDGRMQAGKRGQKAMEFKRGLPFAKPVILCGNRAMGEGNSWDKCNNLIQFCWDWGMDVALQMMERVHRLNSKKPVNIYPILCNGTIDRKLESLLGEKTDSAELVLDGKLIGEVAEEVSLVELLRLAHTEFSSEGTIDEREVEAVWPSLCASLNIAYRALLSDKPSPPVEQRKAEEVVRQTLQAPIRRILTLADLPSFRAQRRIVA